MMRDRKYTHGYMSIIAFLLVINHFLMWKRGVGWGDYLQSFSFGKKEEGGGISNILSPISHSTPSSLYFVNISPLSLHTLRVDIRNENMFVKTKYIFPTKKKMIGP